MGGIAGVLTGALGILLSLSPWGAALEEGYGLRLLFHLRGRIAPPPEVIVVSLDSASARTLSLPDQPWKWPRSLHARLVDRLVSEGARVIAFDLVFEDPRPDDQDGLFARAMERAGSVVLCEFMKKEAIHLGDGEGKRLGEASVERLVKPTPVLAGAAVARAPFPLPKVPVQVSRFWTFKTSAADKPTLPVVVLQVYGLPEYKRWMDVLGRVAPHWVPGLPATEKDVLGSRAGETLVTELRTLFRKEPHVAGSLMAMVERMQGGLGDRRQALLMGALARMYAHPEDSLYLNYYGPPGTLATVSYHRLVTDSGEKTSEGPPLDFRGKAVFVGLSELSHPQQMDAFHTVFSQPDGVDICGVEIAATAFANLLHGSWLKPVDGLSRSILLAVWGFLLGWLCWGLSTPGAALTAGVSSLLYLTAAWWFFSQQARWVPVVIPVFAQMPSVLLASLLWKYRESNRERRNVERALGHYLPAHIVELVGRNLDVTQGCRAVHGVCLFSDISRFTAFSEGLEPSELRDLLNRYYQRVFEPVGRYRGIVSDLVGDSMLAIWAGSSPSPRHRGDACRAALEMLDRVRDFNRDSAPLNLPLRLGAHAGEMVLGALGAHGHYEYRPVGDVVNTASRIEELNKHLGTQVLVSGDVMRDLEGFARREIGDFVLLGKSRPVRIFELAGAEGQDAVFPDGFLDVFAEGLALFGEASWAKALVRFQQCQGLAPGDGPSRFYAQICGVYLVREPEAPWGGCVVMTSK
jgi:adenylate cyclase